MSTTFNQISRRLWLGTLCSLAGIACGDGELAELGIYDHLVHGGKDDKPDARPDARTDTRPPAKSDAGTATTDPKSDAGTPNAAEPAPQDAGAPPTKADAAVPFKGGSGGAHNVPVAYDDPDLKCYKLTAFQRNDKSKPYSVPTIPDYHVAFDLKAPWKGKQYVRAFKSAIDNSDVVDRVLLFKQSADGAEKVTENALGAHPEGIMLYGWAPGGDDLYLDPDVGIEIDGSVLYQLELHYNNKSGQAAPDASGFEVCVTPDEPTHVAGLSWLGTDAIAGTSAQGRCAHESSEPIHVISAQPQMRVKGSHMKVELARASGAKEVMHDAPFSFEQQRSYVLDQVLQPGDVVTTTCTYSETAMFGKGANEEICYFYALHWPAGALSSTGVATLIHGANSCMDI